MANEITAVRTITVAITTIRSTTGRNRPADYVLVPFNDPGTLFSPIQTSIYYSHIMWRIQVLYLVLLTYYVADPSGEGGGEVNVCLVNIYIQYSHTKYGLWSTSEVI